jgi:hypothetical protein
MVLLTDISRERTNNHFYLSCRALFKETVHIIRICILYSSKCREIIQYIEYQSQNWLQTAPSPASECVPHLEPGGATLAAG